MYRASVRLLFFVFAFIIITGTNCKESLFDVSDSIKEDLFNIYTGVALTERNVAGVQVSPDNITYYLYTKNNPVKYIKIDSENPVELNNAKVPIAFIIHGWLEHRGKDWYEDLKDAFLKRNDQYYVVQVDWSPLSFQGYLLSSESTKDVGGFIGQFIVDLHNKYSIPLSNFLVVGHSLGGQISGFIGKKVQELADQKLPRIVALDPAGPFFTQRPSDDERLSKNDAEVVHVIHTDGDKFGYESSVGTIDFFPNGGNTQPGCKSISLTDPKTIADPVICDHQRSWKYFIEAIANPEEFQARKCKDWDTYETTSNLCDGETASMGDLDTKLSGDFYLSTNSESPFGDQINKKEEL